jgi:hypothetical protein
MNTKWQSTYHTLESINYFQTRIDKVILPNPAANLMFLGVHKVMDITIITFTLQYRS